MGRMVEGLWDCECCSTKGIKGRYRDCPNCGSPRDENTKFYLPDNISANYVDKTKEKVSSGPDWICPYCDSLNSSDVDTCVSCGASKTESTEDYFTKQNTSNSVKTREVVEELTSVIPSHETLQSEKKVNTKAWKIILASILGVLLIIGGIFLFIPREKNVTVTSLYWERSVNIEEYVTVEEKGNNLPEDARLKFYANEVVGSTQVIVDFETEINEIQKTIKVGEETSVIGYEDKGNGYFEEVYEKYDIYDTYTEIEIETVPIYEEVPVYETIYYYEIDKWVHARSIKTKGTDKKPYFSNENLNNNERVSTKSEAYYINVKEEKGKEKRYEIEYSEWKNINPKDNITIKVNIFGEAKIIN